ncbi:putative N-acetyltransferase HLS1-like [Tasmannia lanceolata]|uniref:putative N-acetyltransferase HLS1-like n=1 Tax=Tasmannia lanceolata TaxID=3420 RepID=UPI004062C192
MEENLVVVVVREFNAERDREAVEEMESRCEVGPSGKPAIFTDSMGDPICRIRHSPAYLMLVAEYGEERKIVGVIRGCIKTVTRGKKTLSEFPVYTKVAYILGLRVSPTHRRQGIGTKLVQHLEEWCKQKGAEYSYMATDCGNEPSINLFTLKFAYAKFRTPTILIDPVHAHRKPIGSKISIVRLSPPFAESVYRRLFSNSEFFPKDIDAIFSNKLNLGTFMALPKKWVPLWDPQTDKLPPSFSILSVWNSKEVFKFQVRGVSTLTYACCVGSRLLDGMMPWLRIPSIPDVFRPFGVYLLYGLHMEGKGGVGLMRGLCRFVHNMGREDVGCGAVVAEVGRRDPVREGVPHWRRFSWAEDVWCMKKLSGEESGDDTADDWIRSRPTSPVVFVDPRDF